MWEASLGSDFKKEDKERVKRQVKVPPNPQRFITKLITIHNDGLIII
jgi:hypothetical protein